MTAKKQSKRISLSVPHDDWEQFQADHKEMLEMIANAISAEDTKIASAVYRALVKNFTILATPQDYSDLATKAQLSTRRLHIAFWIDKHEN